MATWAIDKVEQVSELSPQGRLVDVHKVTYHIGGQGPFTKTFPEDGFSGETVKAYLDQRARDFQTLGVPTS